VPVSGSAVREGLVVEIWASADLVQLGDRVKLRATVTNETNRMSTRRVHIVDLKDRPVFDIVVETDMRQVLARWSDGKALTRDLTYIELKPGESRTIEMDYKVSDCCHLVAKVIFIESERFVHDPLRASISIYVGRRPFGILGP